MDFVTKALGCFKPACESLSNTHINRARCRRLSDRLQMIERHVTTSFRRKSQNHAKFEGVFRSLTVLLTDIPRTCSSFSKSQWVARCVKEGDDAEYFATVNKRLAEYINGLQMGVDTQTIFVQSIDEQDLKKDQQLVEEYITSLTYQVQQNRFEDGINPETLYQQLMEQPSNPRNIYSPKLKILITQTEEVYKSNRNRRADIQRLLLATPGSSSSAVAATTTQIPFSELVMLEKRGESSFSTTFHGKYKRDHVSIKKIRTTGLNSTTINDFLHDLDAWSKIRSRNICTLFGYCVGSSHVSLVVEWMSKGSLRDALASKEYFPWQNRMIVLRHTAMGLAFLHQQIPPVIHQNLKSTNIVINDAGLIKISDFCLSSLKKEMASKNRNQTSAWSIPYTAPEILDPSSKAKPSESSDVYSFGIIMCEMSTRQEPFSDVDPSTAIVQICRGKRPDYMEDPECFSGYYPLMEECWHQNPLLRPPTDKLANRIESIANIQSPSMPKALSVELPASDSSAARSNSRLNTVGDMYNGDSADHSPFNQSISPDAKHDSVEHERAPLNQHRTNMSSIGGYGSTPSPVPNMNATPQGANQQSVGAPTAAAGRRGVRPPTADARGENPYPSKYGAPDTSNSTQTNPSYADSSTMNGNGGSNGANDLLPKLRRAARLQQDNLDLASQAMDTIPPQITTLTSVTKLNLRDNKLTSLPEYLTELSGLRHLDIRANPIQSLPSFLLQLSALQELLLDRHLVPPSLQDFAKATLTGSGGSDQTSSEQLKQSTSMLLRYLEFVRNQEGDSFNEIAVAYSTDAKELDLSKKDLNHLSPNIGMLSLLIRLQIQQNKITELIPSLFDLTRLVTLNAANNQITGLPNEVSQLINLKSLLLGQNRLSTLPEALTCATSLRKLVVDGNPLVEPPLDLTEETPFVMFYLSLPLPTRMFIRGASETARGNVHSGALCYVGCLEVDASIVPAVIGLRAALGRLPRALEVSSSTNAGDNIPHMRGVRVDKEEYRAATLIQRAREASPESQNAGRNLLIRLTSADADPMRTREYMNLLGLHFTFLDPQPAERAKWFRLAAEQGHADAQFHLAICYRDGIVGGGGNGTGAANVSSSSAVAAAASSSSSSSSAASAAQASSLTDAANWFRKAAEQGHADAQFHLAVRCERGEGCHQNLSEAARWFQAAADSGHAIAQYSMGYFYEHGTAVPKNDAQAIVLYRKAALQGHVASEISYGRMLQRGVSLPNPRGQSTTPAPPSPSPSPSPQPRAPTPTKGRDAAKKMERPKSRSKDDGDGALVNGKRTATAASGGAGAEGKDGVDATQEALRCFRSAADKQHPTAYFYLGWCYEMGLGVKRDEKEAMKWYQMAYDVGSTYASVHIDVLTSQV